MIRSHKVLSKMTTKSAEGYFRQLNLSRAHARVYFSLLEDGASPASYLAKKAQVPRSSCYYLLKDLSDCGLVSVTSEETKKIFSPSSPERLKDLLEEKVKESKRSLKEAQSDLLRLQTLYASQRPQFPKVRFYESERGLKTVYFDGLASSEILIICQGSAEAQKSLKDDPSYLKDFIRESTKRGLRTREILEDSGAAREYQKKYASKKHQIIITPPNPQTAFGHVDKHIYNGKIAYLDHDNLVGVIIEDQTLAGHERALFETLWEYYAKPARR